MSAPLITTSICAAAAAAAARRSSSSTLTRIAAFATSATATATTPNLGFHRSGGQRRCFAAHGRDASPLRRTTTNDIVGGRSTIGVFTPITASLWIERLQREEGATLPPKPAEGPLPPSASAVAVFYSFTSDAQLRELYRNPWGGVRIGRILEDLDSLAGSIALNHFDGGNAEKTAEKEEERRRPPVLVTASVDAIRLLSPLSVEEDVEARGQVVYTGKTSMDIRLELFPVGREREGGRGKEGGGKKRASSSSPPSPALVAHFTFACRDESNRPLGIPQLAPETPVEKRRFAERAAQAEERRRKRQAKAAAAVAEVPSSEASQIEAVADLLVREAAAAADLPALASGDAIPSQLTATGNTFLCQPQQRNITGRVFGGFLMRRAFEMAFASCYVHCGFRPRFVELERVEFMAPVAVGDLLRLRGKVLHVSSSTAEATVRIRVRADVVKPEQAASEISNTFVFAFEVPLRERGGGGRSENGHEEEGALSVKRVLPETREEALAAAAYEVMAAEEEEEA